MGKTNKQKNKQAIKRSAGPYIHLYADSRTVVVLYFEVWI